MLSDGTSNLRITLSSHDEWQKELAPPAKVVEAYLRGQMTWTNAVVQYMKYLRQPEVAEKVRILAQRALGEDLTILCRESTPERCHRRLLAMRCKFLIPELDVVLK